MTSVIVIGAGVIGATVAWELASAGHRVHLIDARTPGDGATRASAGVLAPYIEGAPASPLRELGRDSLERYDEFIARLKDDSHTDVIYDRRGTLELAMTADEATRLSHDAATLARDGVEAQWLSGAALVDLDPNVSRQALGGLFVPIHGSVGVSSLTMAAVTAAVERGARVMVETGAIDVSSQGGVTVRTAQGTLTADQAVMAAGSWSSRVTVQGADPLPVKPIRGQLLQLGGSRGLLRRVVWGARGYLVPWPDGTVLAGATVEDVGFDERTTSEARRSLMEMAVSLAPALANADIADVRAGLRPRGPDNLPMIGRSQAVPGLIYATAHYRNGILLAPLTATLVRALIEDESFTPPAPVRPDRHGTRT
ncbi:MAG: glycine oxidase ThiO [Acidobacteria bacterium]|nr:glycine oxidase ThiO [Acidobacteriota bacterium]